MNKPKSKAPDEATGSRTALANFTELSATLASFAELAAARTNIADLMPTATTVASFAELAAARTNIADLMPTATTLASFAELMPNASALANLRGVQFEELIRSIGESTDSAALIKAADRIFDQVPASDEVLTEAAIALDLTVPFGHDPVVRAALQIVVTAIIGSVLFGVNLLTHPVTTFFSSVLSVSGTPKPKDVWKATGKAYDRIYGVENYHPEKEIRGKRTPPRSRKGYKW